MSRIGSGPLLHQSDAIPLLGILELAASRVSTSHATTTALETNTVPYPRAGPGVEPCTKASRRWNPGDAPKCFELEFLKFPSEYLDDHGRRINNGDSDWHDHLCGYAKASYDAFEHLGQPQGYRLIARVLNYPDGMIGDIALVVDWKG